jgi:hypothetical protein
MLHFMMENSALSCSFLYWQSGPDIEFRMNLLQCKRITDGFTTGSLNVFF